MILEQAKSSTAEKLTEIILDLQHDPAIEMVILSTEDGIPINSINDKDNKAAAVAGFMLAAARQGFAMLNLAGSREIVIRNKHNQLFVSRIFSTGESKLILILLLNEDIPYKRLMNRVTRRIKTTVEN